jgi:hypothetical protein
LYVVTLILETVKNISRVCVLHVACESDGRRSSLSWVEMVKFLKVARMEWMTSNPALKVLFDAEGDDEEDAVGDVSWESLSQWVDALEIARKRPEVFAARNNDALDKLVDIRIASYDEKCRERERKTEETLKKSTKFVVPVLLTFIGLCGMLPRFSLDRLGSSLWKSRLEAIFSSGVKKAGGIGTCVVHDVMCTVARHHRALQWLYGS